MKHYTEGLIGSEYDHQTTLIATDSEWRAIVNALRTAANVFDADAEVCGDVMPAAADQFTQQAAEARALAATIVEEAGV